MSPEDLAGRWRTSRELPFFGCAQENGQARDIRQLEEGEKYSPLAEREIEDSAKHPRRLERKNLQPGSNIPILRCMREESELGVARGICYSRRTDDHGE